MSKVTLPGFSAEASLYKTGGHYHLVGVFDQSYGTMHPAQWALKVGVKEGIKIKYLREGICARQYEYCLREIVRDCCQACRNNLYKTCVPLHGLELCKGLYRPTCSSECEAWQLGGCDQLVPF